MREEIVMGDEADNQRWESQSNLQETERRRAVTIHTPKGQKSAENGQFPALRESSWFDTYSRLLGPAATLLPVWAWFSSQEEIHGCEDLFPASSHMIWLVADGN